MDSTLEDYFESFAMESMNCASCFFVQHSDLRVDDEPSMILISKKTEWKSKTHKMSR